MALHAAAAALAVAGAAAIQPPATTCARAGSIYPLAVGTAAAAGTQAGRGCGRAAKWQGTPLLLLGSIWLKAAVVTAEVAAATSLLLLMGDIVVARLLWGRDGDSSS